MYQVLEVFVGITYLYDQKIFKNFRFLADADWNLVSKYVTIENPFGETNLVYRVFVFRDIFLSI